MKESYRCVVGDHLAKDFCPFEEQYRAWQKLSKDIEGLDMRGSALI